MRYVRVCVNAETNEVLAVIEQPVPFVFGGVVELPGVPTRMIDLGLCEDFSSGDAGNRAAYIRERLEAHPLAGTHEDAPLVRFHPDVTDAPALHFSPCTEAAIVAHIDARGNDALPDVAKQKLRQCWALRDDVPLKTLAAIGYSFAELKNHPRALANARRLEDERKAEADAAAQAAQQARIERRLNKPTTPPEP